MAKNKSYLVVGESQTIGRGDQNIVLTHGETVSLDSETADEFVANGLVEEVES